MSAISDASPSASFEEDARARLLERYEARSKTFFQVFSATLIFAAAFLAFVLVPLVGLQRDEQTIAVQLAAAKQQRDVVEARLAELVALKQQHNAQQDKLAAERARIETEAGHLEEDQGAVQMRNDQIELGIDRNARETQKLKEQSASLKRLQEASRELPVLDVDRFVRDLQAFLPRGRKVVDGRASASSLGLGGDCLTARRQEHFNCLVKAKVMQALKRHSAAIDQRVVVPARQDLPELGNAVAGHVADAIQKFEDILDGKPGFWMAVTEKFHVGREFGEVLSEVSTDIRRTIESEIAAVGQRLQENERRLAALEDEGVELQEAQADIVSEEREIDELLAEMRQQIEAVSRQVADTEGAMEAARRDVADKVAMLTELVGRQSEIDEKKTDIRARIDNVESPFGTLPIGLNEALQIFPVIVAIGVLVYGMVLGELISLRRYYHLAMRETFPADHLAIDAGMTALAPVFVDPCRGAAANLWRTVVAGAPVVIYFVSIFLIAESWSLDGAIAESTGEIRTGYVVLYVVFAVWLLLPLARVAAEWRNYRRDLFIAA